MDILQNVSYGKLYELAREKKMYWKHLKYNSVCYRPNRKQPYEAKTVHVKYINRLAYCLTVKHYNNQVSFATSPHF